MDPSYPFSYTGLLNDDTNEENTNPPQLPSQFQQSVFPQYQQPRFPPFQPPRFPPYQQPGGFNQSQWEQFLQWQQFQGIQQPQFQQQLSQHVDASPSSKEKAPTKKKKKEKKIVEESETTNRTRWPPGDEVLLFKATISIGEDPAIGNNQTNNSYWSRIEEYYNGSGPQVRRGASKIRSHYHLIKPRLNKFNELYLQSKSTYRSGWSDDNHIDQAKSNFLEHESNKTKQPFTYEHVWKIMKDTQMYCGVTQVNLNQSSKRTKTSSTGEYTSSASDANFGNIEVSLDINVLNQSPLFNEILEGTAPECNFTVNGNVYTKGYYLADGIYPEWATLVKSFTYPPENNLKMKLFKKRQESARKDVERAFGVLQARWGIISGPSRSSSIPLIGDIMHACVILHNMIIKDEGRAIFNWESNENDPEPNSYSQGAPLEFQTRLQRFHNLRNQEAHQAIRNDLVEHIWATNQ